MAANAEDQKARRRRIFRRVGGAVVALLVVLGPTFFDWYRALTGEDFEFQGSQVVIGASITVRVITWIAQLSALALLVYIARTAWREKDVPAQERKRLRTLEDETAEQSVLIRQLQAQPDCDDLQERYDSLFSTHSGCAERIEAIRTLYANQDAMIAAGYGYDAVFADPNVREVWIATLVGGHLEGMYDSALVSKLTKVVLSDPESPLLEYIMLSRDRGAERLATAKDEIPKAVNRAKKATPHVVVHDRLIMQCIIVQKDDDDDWIRWETITPAIEPEKWPSTVVHSRNCDATLWNNLKFAFGQLHQAGHELPKPTVPPTPADDAPRLAAKKWYRDYGTKAYDAALKVLNTCPGSLGPDQQQQIVSGLVGELLRRPLSNRDSQFANALSADSFKPHDILRWAKDYRQLLAWISEFVIYGGGDRIRSSTQWEEWQRRHAALVESTPGALGHDAFDDIQDGLMDYLDVTPGDSSLRP